MRLNGIRLLGSGWTPEDPRYHIIERLPPDVADLIAMAVLGDDPTEIVYKLKVKKAAALTAHVDRHLAEAEAELWAEANGEPPSETPPTFH